MVMEIDLTLCGGFSPRLWEVEVYVSSKTQKKPQNATLMKLYKGAKARVHAIGRQTVSKLLKNISALFTCTLKPHLHFNNSKELQE